MVASRSYRIDRTGRYVRHAACGPDNKHIAKPNNVSCKKQVFVFFSSAAKPGFHHVSAAICPMS